MKKISILLAVLAVLAFPGVAMGQGSGADEYSENIPGGGGNQPSNQDDNGSGGGGGSELPSGTQQDLAAQGDDGAAAANLAQQTGPAGNGSGGQNAGGEGSGGAGNGSSDSGSSVNLTPADEQPGSTGGSGIDEVVGELAGGSDDGMGILLPIILGSVLVAAVAFVLIRRSGGSAGSA